MSPKTKQKSCTSTWLVHSDSPCRGTCITCGTCTCFASPIHDRGNSMNNLPKIKFCVVGGHLPSFATDGSAGLDCYTKTEVTVTPKEAVMVSLGFKVAIPEGYVGLLVPRSSTTKKFNIELDNTVGIIDSDFRGEVHARIRINSPTLEKARPITMDWKRDDSIIVPADAKICQLVIVPVLTASNSIGVAVTPNEFAELDTERGKGGWGSTDIETCDHHWNYSDANNVFICSHCGATLEQQSDQL